jgi:hypothetical protein
MNDIRKSYTNHKQRGVIFLKLFLLQHGVPGATSARLPPLGNLRQPLFSVALSNHRNANDKEVTKMGRRRVFGIARNSNTNQPRLRKAGLFLCVIK